MPGGSKNPLDILHYPTVNYIRVGIGVVVNMHVLMRYSMTLRNTVEVCGSAARELWWIFSGWAKFYVVHEALL